MDFCFTGTSGAVCSGSNSNVSLFVRTGTSFLLIDCPGDLPLKAERIGYDLLDLDLLILTHCHPDHLYGLPQLMQHFLLLERDRDLIIATNPSTAEKAKSLLDLYSLSEKDLDFTIHWKIINHGPVYMGTDLSVDLLPVRHSVPTSGVLLCSDRKKLLYTSDTGPGSLLSYSPFKPDVLIHEASGLSEKETLLNKSAHSSARQAGESAVYTEASRLFLCHFSDSSEAFLKQLKEEARRSFNDNVMIPEQFLIYQL